MVRIPRRRRLGLHDVLTMLGRLAFGVVFAFFAGCATGSSAPPAPAVPPFTGEPSEVWFLDDVGHVDHEDVLPAFEASARAYGCDTQEIGSDTTHNVHGEMRSYYGINASCPGGSIAIVTLTRGVRLGCAKPLTRAGCNDLLRRISQAR
jgi:hypothetical protein